MTSKYLDIQCSVIFKVRNVEYVYGAMLLHSVGKEINEENLKKVINASGAKADTAQIKALIASLEGINIDEAIKTAAPVAAAVPAPAVEAKEKAEKKKEEKKEVKGEEEAASGLASLFG